MNPRRRRHQRHRRHLRAVHERLLTRGPDPFASAVAAIAQVPVATVVAPQPLTRAVRIARAKEVLARHTTVKAAAEELGTTSDALRNLFVRAGGPQRPANYLKSTRYAWGTGVR